MSAEFVKCVCSAMSWVMPNEKNMCMSDFDTFFEECYPKIEHSVRETVMRELKKLIRDKMIEDIEINDTPFSCESRLVDDLTKVMRSLVSETVPEVCFGCVHDKASQKHHDLCLNPDDMDRLLGVFDAVWIKVRGRVETPILRYIKNKVKQRYWERNSGIITVKDDDDDDEPCCFPGK